MKVAAVICEYNPFHRGHALQFRQIRRHLGDDTAIVCIMSGNYVQRGEPAILSKYERARMALLEGASLVLELPFPYSASEAMTFAGSAVHIINALGCVDYLCFGSECGDTALLTATAQRLLSPAFLSFFASEEWKERKRADGTAEQYADAYATLYPDAPEQAALLRLPNNVLGLEYVKALIRTGSSVKPIAFHRVGADYRSLDTDTEFVSAASVRNLLLSGDRDKALSHLPASARQICRDCLESGQMPADTNRLSNAILAFLRIYTPNAADDIANVGGGLLHRLCRCAVQAKDLSEFMALCATKKYTNAHIRRGILSLFFGVTSSMLKEPPRYTTLLASDEKGRALLGSIRHTKSISLLTKPASFEKLPADAARQAAFSLRADSVYSLLLPKGEDGGCFMRTSPLTLCRNLSTDAEEGETK